MKKILFLLFTLFFLSGCTKKSIISTDTASDFPKSEPIVSPLINNLQNEPKEFTAKFEIYTRGTKRIFSEKKYHNQSADVYIQNPDPYLIQVKKNGVTWNDFFKTLPFSLTENCLVTGTQQTFCTNESEKLRFWLNEVETPEALNLTINPNDFLKIEYAR